MELASIQQFKQKWELGEKDPVVTKIERKPRELDFSLSTVLNRFIPYAEKALERGKIEKADYDELISLVAKLKKVLDKIKDKDIIAAAINSKTKRRAFSS